MIVRLSYSGHVADRWVEVSEDEWDNEIAPLVEGKFIFDTPEGREKLEELQERATFSPPYAKTITAYQ